MPVQEQVTMGQTIDEALDILYRSIQRPMAYSLGSVLNATDITSTFTVTSENSTLNIGDLLEAGLEQIRITSIDSNNPRNITAARGFAGSTVQTHAIGDILLVNPGWYRMSVYRSVLRGLKGAIPNELPNLKTFNFVPTQNQYYQAMPADCIRPIRMAFIQTDSSSIAKKFRVIDDWAWEDDVDTGVATNGGLITVPVALCNNVTVSNTTIYVTYQAPYVYTTAADPTKTTNTPLEADYIQLDTGATDLPALYAAAYLTANREISRLDLDRIEEWSQEAAIRQGNNLRLIQQVWQEFYRRLDETRRIKYVTRHRPFRPMHRTTSMLARP